MYIVYGTRDALGTDCLACRWNEARVDKETNSREMGARVTELELLNTSLQQVIVSQQESMATLLAAKDIEIAALKDRLQDTQRGQISPGVAAVPLKQQRYSNNALDALSASDWALYPGRGRRDESNVVVVAPSVPHTEFSNASHVNSSVLTATTTPVVKHNNMLTCSQRTTAPSSVGGAPTTTSAVMSFCDPYSSSLLSHGASTPFPSPFTPPSSRLQTGSTESVFTSRRTLESGQQHERLQPDSSSSALRTIVSRLFREEWVGSKLDAAGREWTKDKDFSLVDPHPINCTEDQRRGSSSLVFSIEHKGHKYILKVGSFGCIRIS